MFPMQPAAVYTRDRCVTGIHGLDEILRGGIPYGSTVLAAGTCGSGKTTLGMEFLVRGALAGEACAHFTATEPSVKLLENIRQYSFFDMNMVDSGLINVFDMDVLYSWLGLEKASFELDDVHALIKAIVDIVNTIGVTRLVIDSVTTLCYKIKSEQLIRDFLFTLGKKLATLGCTTILISEITSATENAHWSLFGVEEAIEDFVDSDEFDGLEDTEKISAAIKYKNSEMKKIIHDYFKNSAKFKLLKKHKYQFDHSYDDGSEYNFVAYLKKKKKDKE